MSDTALIVGDIQNGIVNMILPDAEKQKAYLDNLANTIAAARKAGVHIIYIRVGFRKGYPDIEPNNKFFGPIKQSGVFIEDDQTTQIHAAVAPQEEDVVVIKRRVSAFVGTDLEVVLRAKGVRKLVLTGLSTSGIILSSLRIAADLDYILTVLDDLCADREDAVHNALVEKIFPTQATVEKAAEWAGKL